jgi:hypothetical protein
LRILAFAFAAVALALAGAMVWQQLRYAALRRDPVQDRQSAWYPGAAFHVLSFLRLAEGQDAIPALRELRRALEVDASTRVVYAGRVGVVGIASSQLPQVDWDAVVLVQYPSRDAYRAAAAGSALRGALATFAESYSQGFERPVLLNLALPQLLLALRVYQRLTRQPSHYPFVPAADRRDPRTEASDVRLAALERLRPFGERAVVVVNLLEHGTPEQQRADRAYGLSMAGLFAEGVHGPMHMGRAARLEGDAHFDRVALVYYPGIDYMRELMGSAFFNDIVGGKQPGDTLAVLTVPVLASL